MNANDSSAQDAGVTTSLQKALVGYQVAVEFWINQGRYGWTVLTGMLVANGMIMTTTGLMITAWYPEHRLLATLSLFVKALCLLGLFLCAVWFVFGRRSSATSDYFAMSARELEERHLSDVILTVSRGSQFSRGDTVTLLIDGQTKSMRLNCLGKWIRGKNVPDWVAAALSAIHVVFLGWAFCCL